MNIKKDSAFSSFYKKIVVEGILKAVMLASIVALAAVLVVAFCLWLKGINGIWVALAVYFGSVVVLSPIAYFVFFRPKAKDIAKRVDRLGLEERILTMNELENDQSYIALKQREDAKNTLKSVNAKNLKLSFKTSLIVVLCVSFVLSCGMTTVNVLGASGVIPNGEDFIDDIVNPREKYYTVKYVAMDYDMYAQYGICVETENGIIDGNEEQTIARGENGETVVATADPDYMFYGWFGETDGIDGAERKELAVLVDDSMFDETKKLGFVAFGTLIDGYYYNPNGWTLVKDPESGEITIYVFAFFGSMGTDGSGEGGDGDSPNEDGEDKPSEDNPDNEQNQTSDKDKDKDNNQGDSDQGGFNGKDNEKVIDGSQNFHDRKEEYVNEYNKRKENGEEIPSWLQKIIEDYYGIMN